VNAKPRIPRTRIGECHNFSWSTDLWNIALEVGGQSLFKKKKKSLKKEKKKRRGKGVPK